jgi:hypothetical protein
MNPIAAISLMALASGAPAASSAPYQLPGITICSENACSLNLDDQGYLVDSASKARVFSKPVQETMFNTYSLFRSGDKYVLELENTTSSRNWAALIFSYDAGSVTAERYISMSRSYSPEKIQWSGSECRGGANLQKSYSPFDAASNALCGGHKKQDFIPLSGNSLIKKATAKGLVVDIPVYSNSQLSASSATYFFPQADEPDAGALLCLAGCGVNEKNQKLGGWIGKALWVDVNVHWDEAINKYAGDYFYIGKKGSIPLDGEINKNGINLNEYLPTDDSRQQAPTGMLTGTRDGDAFDGTWSSKKNAKSYDLFLAQRIY